MMATIRQLPRGHGDEEALGAFNDLQIPDDEHVIEGDATKGLQPFVAARVVFHELDADFSDLHSRYSFTWRSLLRGRRSRPGPILVRGVEGCPRRGAPRPKCGTARSRPSRYHSSRTRRSTGPGWPGRHGPGSGRVGAPRRWVEAG